jgi:hypothetical protein
MKRVVFSLIWILSATLIASAQTTFYYPHVVNGVQGPVTWKTTILLTNPASAGVVSGTISFTRDNSNNLNFAGSPMTLTLTDETNATATQSIFTFSIPAGGTRKLVSSGAGQIVSGFATVNANSGTVSGTAIFSEFDGVGNLIGEAGVPSAPAVGRQAIFVDTVGGYQIGVAYANAGAGAANITLNLLNSSAVPVASTAQVIGPGNHNATFTFQMFPSAPPMAGTMQIMSDSPLAAVALRFDPSFTKFTTLPAVTLASLINPAVEWLQERPWLTPLTSIARLLGGLQLRIG